MTVPGWTYIPSQMWNGRVISDCHAIIRITLSLIIVQIYKKRYADCSCYKIQNFTATLKISLKKTQTHCTRYIWNVTISVPFLLSKIFQRQSKVDAHISNHPSFIMFRYCLTCSRLEYVCKKAWRYQRFNQKP
jgi:hypothetical protein